MEQHHTNAPQDRSSNLASIGSGSRQQHASFNAMILQHTTLVCLTCDLHFELELEQRDEQHRQHNSTARSTIMLLMRPDGHPACDVQYIMGGGIEVALMSG